jgi:hypothetical protein
MSITLVHNFHSKVCTVKYVTPGWNNLALRIKNRLIEVETVQVESHGANAHGCKPNTYNWEDCQEEVKTPTVVKAGILEDQATKVTVSSHDVVGLFLLAKLIAVVL